MIARAACAALAAAIEQGGGVDAAYAALQRADPLVRGPARRRVRGAWADACLATRVRQGEEGERHTLRIAYLLAARAPPYTATIDDVAAVEASFDRARSARPGPVGGFWWATSLAVLALLAAGGAGALLVLRELYVPRLPPLVATTARSARPPRGVYETGGVPVPGPGDTAIRQALGTDVPDFLIALDRWSKAKQAGDAGLAARDAEMGEALRRALAPRARAALGESAANALAGLLGAARAAAEAPPGDAAEKAGDVLLEATGAFDDELAAEGLGYFVDGDVITDGASGKRLVLLYSFEVERVRIFASGSATVRALHLRRLDSLNWTQALLGFTRPNLRAALVLRQKLEEQVLDLIGPGLAKEASVPLFDPEAGPDVAETRARVEARAGELVRAEYGALPGVDAVDARAGKFGDLLGRRRALLESWKARVADRGLSLVAPPTLRLPDGFARSVEGYVPRAEVTELRGVDEGLGEPERGRMFAALADALGTSVERHEVQHRLDATSPRVMPELLARHVGPLEQGGRERRHAATARAELNAYLAELARDDQTTGVGLTLIARFLFDRHMHGTAESYAALTILEGLAEDLGGPPRAPMLAGGAIDRRAVAEVYLTLAAWPRDRLRGAARKLWEKLFEAPLPELRVIGG